MSKTIYLIKGMNERVPIKISDEEWEVEQGLKKKIRKKLSKMTAEEQADIYTHLPH